MDQAATWYGGRPRPRPHCVTWGPSCHLPKGAQPPIFGQCLLWPNARPSQLLLSSCQVSAIPEQSRMSRRHYSYTPSREESKEDTLVPRRRRSYMRPRIRLLGLNCHDRRRGLAPRSGRTGPRAHAVDCRQWRSSRPPSYRHARWVYQSF